MSRSTSPKKSLDFTRRQQLGDQSRLCHFLTFCALLPSYAACAARPAVISTLAWAKFELDSPAARLFCDSPFSGHFKSAKRILCFLSRSPRSDTGAFFWRAFLIDCDVAFLLHTLLKPCLSIFFFSHPCPSRLILSFFFCSLVFFFCLPFVSDHGCQNKGHWFLLLDDELSPSDRSGSQTHWNW